MVTAPKTNMDTQHSHMGVSKNSGTPKWMVKIMENPIKMDDLGVPLFSEKSIFERSHISKNHHVWYLIITFRGEFLAKWLGKDTYSTSS